jgi:hypothetical protein
MPVAALTASLPAASLPAASLPAAFIPAQALGATVFTENILPLLIVFFLGYGVKLAGLFNKEAGHLFLKFVFFISLPALIFVSVKSASLTPRYALLPAAAAAITLVTFGLSQLFGRLLRLSSPKMGVFTVGVSIMNLTFVFPFIIAAWGDEGFSIASVFNLGCAVLHLTLLYYMAGRYGKREVTPRAILKRFVSATPLWALLIAVGFNLYSIETPETVTNLFQIAGRTTTPLILFALGLHFNPRIRDPLPLVSVIVLRIGAGFGLGLLFVNLFEFQDLAAKVVLACCAAPSGFNTLVFSSLEGLDIEFASSVVSYTILVSLAVIPVIMLVV